jgi:hypothetical protein
MKFTKILALSVALFTSAAFLSAQSTGPTYPGPRHTESHGGTYSGGQGSSHKGGTYHGPTGGGYGRHK